ncbi:hypothetical protein L0337_01770 [candidate division KSB1 bacterium]|nr:hypothetical protein [candidate division KSB1 bacterium]
MKRPHARNFDPVVASWQWRWAQDHWLSKRGLKSTDHKNKQQTMLDSSQKFRQRIDEPD